MNENGDDIFPERSLYSRTSQNSDYTQSLKKYASYQRAGYSSSTPDSVNALSYIDDEESRTVSPNAQNPNYYLNSNNLRYSAPPRQEALSILKIIEHNASNNNDDLHEISTSNSQIRDHLDRSDLTSSKSSELNNTLTEPITVIKNVTDMEEDEEAQQEERPKTDRFGFILKPGSADTIKHSVARKLNPTITRKREKKWLKMFENWHKFIAKDFPKARERCRKGIPPSLRGRAWCFLCGAYYHQQEDPVLFQRLDAAEGDPQWIDQIERDVFRQFPTHEMFVKKDGLGQKEMFRLLKAYSIYKPEVGYCQAMAPVAGTLLTQMPVEDAFYCFIPICERYVANYYSPGLDEVQRDGEILTILLRKYSYRAYKHLKRQGIMYHQYLIEWYMCLFTRTLPWSTLLRVWDIFLCEGIKFFFRLAVALLKELFDFRGVEKRYPNMEDTSEVLKHIPPAIMEEEYIIRKAFELPITGEYIARMHRKVEKRRERERIAEELRKAKKQ